MGCVDAFAGRITRIICYRIAAGIATCIANRYGCARSNAREDRATTACCVINFNLIIPRQLTKSNIARSSGVRAVSYTHLDVYKRQPLDRESGTVLGTGI